MRAMPSAWHAGAGVVLVALVLSSGSAHAAEPDPYAAALSSGWQALGVFEYQAAAESYRRATVLVPDSEEAWLGLQLAYLQDKRWAESIAAGQRVLALNANSFWGHSRQAYALWNLGEFDDSAQHYEAAIALNPSDATMWIGLGYARLGLGDQAGAREACTTARASIPDDYRVPECLALANRRTVHLGGTVTGGAWTYPDPWNSEGILSLTVSANARWEWGAGLWAGVGLSKTALAYDADDYTQTVPAIGFWLNRSGFVGELGFAWVTANDDAVDGAAVLPLRLGYLGAVWGAGVGTAVSLYPTPAVVVQLDPWLHWRPTRWLALEAGPSIGLTLSPERGRGFDDETLVSGWLELTATPVAALGVSLSLFGGPRRHRIEAGGLSVWTSDERSIAGYRIGLTWHVTRWLDVFGQFRHDFGDEQADQSRDFQLIGGTVGLSAEW